MKKTTAILAPLLMALALGGCAHTAPLAMSEAPKAAQPPTVAAATAAESGAHMVAVPKSSDEGGSHWLACRSTKRLCQILMPHEAGDTVDQVAFKHTLCQLYLQFECPQGEEEANRG